MAIQDAMGWLDHHLHEFRLLDPTEKEVVSIGIPTDEDPIDRPVIPGWDVPLSRFFERRGWHAPPAMYAYDFGDDWEHVIVHEGMEPVEESLTYPRCVSGARRGPPEDCGGVHGYAEFLQAIARPNHPEHESLLQWAGGSFDPDAFMPAVVFDDPRKRWKKAFEDRRLLRDARLAKDCASVPRGDARTFLTRASKANSRSGRRLAPADPSITRSGTGTGHGST